MICRECGNTIDDKAKFCKFCGYKIPDEQRETQKVCSECGKPNDSEMIFCGHCGHRFESEPAAPTPPESEITPETEADAKKNKAAAAKVVAVIAVVTGSVLLLGGLASKLLHDHNKSDAKDNTSANVSEADEETDDNDIAAGEYTISANGSQIILTDPDNNEHIIGEYDPVTYFDYDVLLESLKEHDTYSVYNYDDDYNRIEKDISEIENGDNIHILSYDYDQPYDAPYDKYDLKHLVEDLGVRCYENDFRSDSMTDFYSLYLEYSSDNNSPTGFPVSYEEEYIVDGHDTLYFAYDIDVYSSEWIIDSLINDLYDEIEDYEFEYPYYDWFDGNVYIKTKFIDVYTTANNICFLITQEEEKFVSSNGDEKTFTTEYTAYSLDNHALHEITVSSLELVDVKELPDSIDMLTEIEFKLLLNEFSK